MSHYGQFCSIARAHEALGGRWTILIVRELLCGCHRFNDIRRGLPRISKTVLSERLAELVRLGVVERQAGAHGPGYVLTAAGHDLIPMIEAFATWGQRWLKRSAAAEDLDLDPVLVDMARRLRSEALPGRPFVIRFALRRQAVKFLLLRVDGPSLCDHNPGFPEPLCVRGPLSALAAWWRGDATFAQARSMGLTCEGPRALARAFPNWFEQYQFAHVPSAISNASMGRR